MTRATVTSRSAVAEDCCAPRNAAVSGRRMAEVDNKGGRGRGRMSPRYGRRRRNRSEPLLYLPPMAVFDLQIHPRDHEMMAATHGRSIGVVDIAALEQMTPKVL